MEMKLDGGEPRVLLEGVPMVNAFEVGPDGMLYFPVMAANEIWRISLDGGAPQTVARGQFAGRWSSPGGSRACGETLEEAAVRKSQSTLSSR
jgi:8-oxo-dGTP pyrophosphatase MutT (NUDIX family)